MCSVPGIMDEIAGKCPNCSQFYYLKPHQSSLLECNLPLFLACGHSMCENCIRSKVKYVEPIECQICHNVIKEDSEQTAQLQKDKVKFYQLFPVNVLMVGELTLQHLEIAETKPSLEDKEFFVDLHSILKGASKAVCMECHKATTKKCQQCATILCDTCFTKSHKNFGIFKNHVLQENDEMVSPSICKTHSDKPLDYYCNDCKKSICTDCGMIGGDKTCKNHDMVSMQEVNNGFLDELGTITPKVDETFRRLTKTAFDVGHMLFNMENNTGTASELTQIITNIEQHFSKLSSIVQKHKHEVVDMVSKLRSAEKNSLQKAKDDLTNALKKANKVINSIQMTNNPNTIKKMNLAELLTDAKEIVESPWYLARDDVKKDPLKVAVNEDLFGLISDYIHVEGNDLCTYKLCATADLGEDVEIPPPPSAPVFAPELPTDVRQNEQKAAKTKEESLKRPTFFENAPQYRSKKGPVSSLNSCGSDSSQGTYLQTNDHNRPIVQSVQQFPDSKHPKRLCEGSQELIYISHMVNPYNFYVQRACHQELLKDMHRQFRSVDYLPKPSVNNISEGKQYLVFNKADNMWQRCRVVSIDRKDPAQPIIQLLCYDVGCTATATIEKLRYLPLDRVNDPAPLAINCSLANCVPNNGSWAIDDSVLIRDIIAKKQAIIHVRKIRSTSVCTETVDCDVFTYEDGVSLAHALVFHECAKMPNPELKYPVFSGIREKAKIFMTNDDYKYLKMEEVCITHVVSPDKFYVRKKYHQATYEQLSQELEQEYSLAVTTGTIYLPEIGMSCCVHDPGQGRGAGEWARAVVTGLPGRSLVALMLVDSGTPLLAHWKSMRYLHHKFSKRTALATECHLAGVTPLDKKWSPESVALMRQYCERSIELHVEDNRNCDSIGVTLFHHAPELDEPVCINQEMIEYKLVGKYSFNKSYDTVDQVTTIKSPLDKPVRHPKPKPEIQILNGNPPPSKPQKIKPVDLEAKDKGPLRLEAKVLQYQSPSLIYITLEHQQQIFKELFENIQKYYSNNKPVKKTNWQVGARCCTVCIQSQTWRRAVIVEIMGDDAKVYYSDFASVETLPLANLVELTPEFAEIGDAAIMCHLSGVIPGSGKEWPSITKEYLKELLDSYKKIFITELDNYKNKSMPVEIWVYHIIQGGALEPNTSEWRCLNKKIIEQGLGIPDKSDEVVCTETKLEGGDMPMKPLPTLFSESPSTSSTSIKYDDGTELLDSSNVMFISDWQPPESLQRKEFTGVPTYVDDDGVIYLHDVLLQGIYDLIRKSFDLIFRDPDPEAKYQKWVVGEPCIALYFVDNRYYRGRVLDVNNETSTCLIHFIDYGNEEQCSFENLRKSIVLHQIPTQAHKCVLNRIQPIEKQWDVQTLDYIHHTIVDRKCSIQVAGDTVDCITPIELQFDKLCINDHLVELEVAAYKDGSKAIVRRFAPTRPEAKVRLLEPVTDSNPIDIVETDSQDSFEVSSAVTHNDWNQMLEEEEQSNSIGDIYQSYPDNLDDDFECNIKVIHDTKTLELEIVHDDNSALMYEEIFRDLQMDYENMPPLKGVLENKACIAFHQQDHKWYRASIMEYSKVKEKVKVKYVDYGYIEEVDLAHVKETHPDWVKLTPSTVTVQLHGVKLNPELDINIATQEYLDTFLGKGPFTAKVIKKDKNYSSNPIVELHNEAGDLVYQNLIEKKVFLKCESD